MEVLFLFRSSISDYSHLLNIQKTLPIGHTMLGIIAALDKMPLTVGTGSKKMHLFLLSLANITAGTLWVEMSSTGVWRLCSDVLVFATGYMAYQS